MTQRLPPQPQWAPSALGNIKMFPASTLRTGCSLCLRWTCLPLGPRGNLSLEKSSLITYNIHSKPSSKQLFLCCTASLGVRAYFSLDIASEVKCSLHPSHLFLLSSLVLPYPCLSLSCCQNLLSKQTLLLSMIAYIFPLKNKNLFSKCVIKVSSHVKYLWKSTVWFQSPYQHQKSTLLGFHLLHSPLCYVKCQEKVFIKWVI